MTQQELDDIFRENYRQQMEGKHIFDLIRDFRSITNKILVDYGRFKKWVYSKLKRARKQKKIESDPRGALLQSILNRTASQRDESLDEVQSRLNLSIKNGRLTEDLLSEVKSMFGGTHSLSPQ